MYRKSLTIFLLSLNDEKEPMYRTKNCGELRLNQVGQEVTLAGWVSKVRRLGAMTFVDLRDRYGMTQLVFGLETPNAKEFIETIGREWVIQVSGTVRERSAKNPQMPTGEIEIAVSSFKILSPSEVPPFTIEDHSDGGDDLRMRYRYLDIRREPVKKNLILRHKIAFETRKYLDEQGFLEIETPMLIKSTPEGARDFVVPSRMNPGEFYALPQSPQTFKQLLMVAGLDKYFQIVKCFRDEDLRADRQPEFTQIDCEMSFVEQEDILSTFEGLTRHLFRTILDIDLPTPFARMSWDEAMQRYGSDKPDLRFGMTISEITQEVKGRGFSILDDAGYVGTISVPQGANYTRKQIDELSDFVKRPQVGAKGLIYIKCLEDGTYKSSIDKYYDHESLARIASAAEASKGDLLLIMSGEKKLPTVKQLGTLRLHLGDQMNLLNKDIFKVLWVVDFPLFEWDDETQRYYAVHHPFTAPRPEDIPLLDKDPSKVHASAYDMVINGTEVGGGSIRIHDADLQEKIFEVLGFTPEDAQNRFGFLMNAFKYGAPPHGGIAYGLDRWVSLMAGLDSIRDCIAFPKNNMGKDVMIEAPSSLDSEQLEDLSIQVAVKEKV